MCVRTQVCLGDMSEGCWAEFRLQFRRLVDAHLAAHRSAALAEAQAGGRTLYANNTMVYGTSCPRF